MKLKNSLYKITATQVEERSFDLELNAGHEIYKAHFPGKPITPGVCLVQIAQELLEELTGKQLEITAVKNVKFLAVVSPVETPRVTYTVTKLADGDDGVVAQVAVSSDSGAMARISLTCK